MFFTLMYMIQKTSSISVFGVLGGSFVGCSLAVFVMHIQITSCGGFHFVLLNFLISPKLESSKMSGQAGSNRVNFTTSIEEWENEWLSFSNEEVENNGALGKKIRCRICHEDDFVKNMEAPCSCNGSLKFTRSECIHKWCNEKNDTTCEICHQPYDGYNVADQEETVIELDERSNRNNWNQIVTREVTIEKLEQLLYADLMIMEPQPVLE